MREIILEIVKHTGGLGFINIVKVTDNDDETLIEAMDEDKSVIVKGRLQSPLGLFQGEFGMKDLGTVRGLVEHPSFKTDNANLTVINQTDPSDEDKSIPVGIHFSSETGPSATYRFMNSQLVPNQATFKGTNWDVSIKPTASKIAEFASFSSLLSTEQLFMVDTEDKNLRFHLGNPEGTDHFATIVFAEDVKGVMNSGLYWPTSQVLAILKLSAADDIEMKISARGAMMITTTTDLAAWQYILPARKK